MERVFDEVFEVEGEKASYSDHGGVLAEFTVERGSQWQPEAPDPEALRLAHQLLEDGRREAGSRRSLQRVAGGLGMGAALLAASGLRRKDMDRRRFVRASLQAAAVLTLGPGVACSLLSEVFTPEEIRGFDEIEARLAQLGHEPLLLADSHLRVS